MDSMLYKRKWPLFVFLVPAFTFMSVFLYYPFLDNIISSFYKMGALGTKRAGFVGLENYGRMVSDQTFYTALKNTGFIMLCTVIFQLGIAIVLALMVDNIKRGAQFFRTVYFFPIVISATALGLLFNIIFLYNGGMLNQIAMSLGFIDKYIDWKAEGRSMITVAIPVIWQYVGFYFVILATGLTNISEDIYEAAKIDGASGMQKITNITLPLLYNSITTCLTLCVTGALKVFDLPYTMFPNGMGNTHLLGTYMYGKAFVGKNVGFAATIAVVIVLLGIALAQITNAVFKPKEY